VHNPFDLSKAIISTLLESQNKTDRLSQIRNINIPSLGIKATDFEINTHTKNRLYQAGVQAAVDFFEKREGS
jgi:NTE family protein